MGQRNRFGQEAPPLGPPGSLFRSTDSVARIRLILALFLLLVVAVFTAQNFQVVDVRFLAWKLEISRAILVFGLLGIGFVLGWLASSYRKLSSA